MPKIKTKSSVINYTESNVSQEVDLRKLFGVGIKSEAVKQKLGEAFIEKIRQRTAANEQASIKGLSRGGKFKGYSKEYKDSDEFEAYDKSPSDINLTLTGNMLADMDVIGTTRDKVKIGFSDSEETLKAFVHNTGDGRMPKRTFFGLNQGELNSIAKEFKAEIKSLVGKNPDEEKVNSSILAYIDKLSGDDG